MSEKDQDSLPRKVDIFKTRSEDIRQRGKLQENERELIEILQSLDSKYENLLIVLKS